MPDGPSTIVLVHGAWHGGWCWDRVVPLLEARGLDVVRVELPSVGADPESGADLAGDASAVRAAVDGVEGNVLVCGHSYGGMAITEGAAHHPRVTRLVYLCAFMPDAGDSLVAITGGPAPWIQLLDDGMTLPDMTQAHSLFFGDCDAATQEWAVSCIRPMAAAPFAGAITTTPAWGDVPATYVVCTQDRALPPDLQRDLFAPRAEEVVELQTSHSPFLSQPAAVARLLAERAGA
jgi:pimeloyl-ACP methyl ester carboxylesterase